MSKNQFKKDNIDLSNTHYLLHFIKNFDKINTSETEPTTQNINKNIFEEDLSILIDESVNLIFNELNMGIEENARKKHFFNYINKNKISSQEIYNWLLNNQSDSNAIYLLGYFNYYGIETNVINMQKAFELYQKAANLGNDLAQHSIANMYIDGEGVDKNHVLAFELSSKLAEKEYLSGINLLGCCYEDGIGTDINKPKAFELFKKVADLGCSFGMYNLARCYENGIGTDIDKMKASELYKKATELEDAYG
ncbi:hypothetical protein RclHR1_25630002 [Rhizophagus clarus]|uniref:Kinase-like domain-containing protein n=1 Tax=Rhizophagus clarus TaxID=94130 RepID=A0A2Z6RF46_9GLOM|nr:hypothetical protein RclHR1_25630002 [Rhizophagus clarus]GES91033.1 kinase-like domain-containing protein [Rhizophagus clarus]